MRKIYEDIVKEVSGGRPALLATIVDTGGSTPRKPGTKMLVLPDGRTVGTVGGGPVEVEVKKAAVSMLNAKASPRLQRFTSTESVASSPGCGGTILVFLESIGPK
jgi:xanthine dehydrogenase accessory factor